MYTVGWPQSTQLLWGVYIIYVLASLKSGQLTRSLKNAEFMVEIKMQNVMQ